MLISQQAAGVEAELILPWQSEGAMGELTVASQISGSLRIFGDPSFQRPPKSPGETPGQPR